MPLVTIVAHIVIEKQTAYIICCIMPVNTEKMPVESFTEPIADFRLDQPVFQPILIEFPRIVIPGNVHGHFFPMPNSIPRLNVVVASYNRLDLAANFWPYDKVTVNIARIRSIQNFFILFALMVKIRSLPRWKCCFFITPCL